MDMRIGDREREHAIEQLGRHVGDGRLDLAEFDERSGRVTAARTRPELTAVLADLPRLPDPARAAMARRAVLAVTWGPWLVTGVVCLVVWAAVALAGGGVHAWPLWVLGPWGALLVLGTMVLPAVPVAGRWDGRRPERVCRAHAPT
ncbi:MULTISPECIES: DUF1707 SHOCT-like domain-containing protein [Pseudonocardia]|uniref:DUF1707 domain-containing protein n=2 Tax=Pseudonocardia TaxID=1847 RepID=A0A1Y2MYK6_PSEAH|nr:MULTISPECIES: DUF1707 domain-containing protein [Pseudonocardia]OSY39907.1 hypothetical protein BG845_03142 [Pseudonocardia autotrophica]TDN74503.1 uncharacterized protein DUF1707 [Pseudonocardia autotrophica]BBG05271.1 hypothetical protein Pdca_64800 [Pseudonocardia autotrophica]GEC25721.1 hypothetical protein PSA01_27500 [Pseudonocardia saturnea]